MRIGDELGIPPQTLRSIKANWSHQADPLNFIREVFVEWENRQCSPYNWRTVLVALSSKYVGERKMALSLAQTLRREKKVQQARLLQQESSGNQQKPSRSSSCQQPPHKVGSKQQKRRRDDSEESSGSDEDEPQAKRMEREESALGVSSSSSGSSSGELLYGWCIHHVSMAIHIALSFRHCSYTATDLS